MKKCGNIVFFILIIYMLFAVCSCSSSHSAYTDGRTESVDTEKDTSPLSDNSDLVSDSGTEPVDTDAASDTDNGAAGTDSSDAGTEATPPELEVPAFDKIEFTDVSRIAYAKRTLAATDATAKKEIKRISEGNCVLVVGESSEWARISCGDVLGYISMDDISFERSKKATDATSLCGGAVYPGDGKTVAIDAGHQNKGMKEKEPNGPGSDVMKAKLTTGTQGVKTGIAEYVLNLEVALPLRDELIARGYTVVMTRESHNVVISNVERAIIANKMKADVFVRIHANGSEDKTKNGATVFCMTEANPYYPHLYTEGIRLGNTVLDAFSKATGMARRELWETDTMTGINWAEMPTVILERGYMSNASDDEAMAKAEFKPKAALGIANGLDEYFKEA